MSSIKVKLTVVLLDRKNSSQDIQDISVKYDLGEDGVQIRNAQLEEIVTSAFQESIKHGEINPQFTEIESCRGDDARLTFQSVENAYQFVKIFCQRVDTRNQKPDIYQWSFRIGAATGNVIYNPTYKNKISGIVLQTVQELQTGAFPGWLFVDDETYNALPEDIKNNFSKESFENKHKQMRDAWCCQMLSNTSLSTIEAIPTIEEIYNLFTKLTQQAQITRVAQLIGMPNDFRPSNYATLYEAKTAIVNWAEGNEKGEEYRLTRLNKLRNTLHNLI